MPEIKEQQKKNDIKPRIVILYQGPEGTPIRKHVLERLKHYGAEPVEVAFNEEALEDDIRINSRVISAFMKCDAAIALLTKDPRKSSAVGNLWLEVGLWIGLKSRETIRIFQQEHPDDWDVKKDGEWPVKLPSNILGESCPRFKTNEELSERVAVFVEKIRNKMRPHICVDTHTFDGVYRDGLKIKDILMNKQALWEPANLHLCQEREEEPSCVYRKESIGLLCELFRMRQSSREHWLLEACFHRLRHLCKIAVVTDYMKADPFTSAEQRQKAIDEIHQIVNLLLSTAKELLIRPSVKGTTVDDEWERLRFYLNYRLNLTYYLRERSLPSKSVKKLHRQDVDFFCDWAKELADPNYKSLSYYNNGFKPFGPRNQEILAVRRYKKCQGIARGISNALAFLAYEFFSQCDNIINENVVALTDYRKITESIRKVRNGFPQNRPESKLPRIWPRSTRDNEAQQVS